MTREKSNLLERAGRSVCGLVVVMALGTLDSRGSATESAAIREPRSMPVDSPRARRQWAVGIDGWRIEIDGVAVPAAASEDYAVPASDGVPAAVDRDLRLERLALYADSIGRYAAEEGLDWRLVAAVIAEESAFQPNALSPAGAFGLMQVKEEAAREVGVYPYDDPDSNIRAGVRYLAAMRAAFPGVTPRDQLAMMLAAYNMGPGHLRDARSLAGELGLVARQWDDSLATVVRLLEQPEVYGRLRHGFAQGRGVVRYVEKVLEKYGAYRLQFPVLTVPSVAMIADIASR